MEASTPRNPKKPRLSRRILSHFTLTLSVLLALSFVTLAVVGPTTQEAEAIVPIVIPAFLLGAATASVLWNWLNNEINEDLAINSGAAVQSYIDQMGNSYKNYLEIAKAAALNDVEIADLTTNYYSRMAQWGAAELYDHQKINGQPFVYSTQLALDYGNVMENLYDQYMMSKTYYDAILGSISGLQNTFYGDYQAMQFRVLKHSDGSTVAAGTSASPIKAIATNMIINGVGNAITAQNVLVPSNGTLYVCKYMNNDQNPGVTIKSANGSIIWQSPTMGLWQLISIDLKDILPSNKKLQAISISIDASGEKYAAVFGDAINGPFASNNPTIEPAILTMNAGETTWYSMHWTNAGKTNTYGRERDTIPGDKSCRFGIGATDATASVLTMTDDIIALDRAYEKINTLMTVANNYAQTYYNYLVVNGNEGLVPVYPDIVPIDPMMMQNMTATELYAIFIAYMMALEEGFNNGYSVNPGNVNVSLNSLNLICRGAVYNSTGSLVLNDTSIFTPFVAMEDYTLIIGNNTMTQPGFLMKWGNTQSLNESMGNPSNSTFTPETMQYVAFSVNWTLHISQIYYEGKAVDSVTLAVTNLTVTSPNVTGPADPPNVLSDLEWLLSRWYYFAIIAGIICLLAAISFRNAAIIAIGLLLLAAGGIGYYMAGDFSLLDWLSMEPPNLRAWLQHLR